MSCSICHEAKPTCLDCCTQAVCSSCALNYLRVQLLAKKWGLGLIKCPTGSRSCGFVSLSWLRRICAADADLLSYLESVIATIPTTCSPSQLSDFGYVFSGEERKIVNAVKPNNSFHFISEIHYGALGDQIAQHIQHLMTSEFGLQEHHLPSPDQPSVNIFTSPDYQTCSDLLLIVLGSGAVRAGQWARALCLNESLEVGSILPYLTRAQALGYGVVVFNCNLNQAFVPDQEKLDSIADPQSYWLQPSKAAKPPGAYHRIPGHRNSLEHTLSVYDQFVASCGAANISIVAHSAGGSCTMHLLRQRPDVLQRLRCIAFTDSVHSISRADSREVREFLQRNAVNFAQSDRPLDTLLREASANSCRVVSAGHPKHEWTSASAIESVFTLLKSKMNSH